VRLIL